MLFFLLYFTLADGCAYTADQLQQVIFILSWVPGINWQADLTDIRTPTPYAFTYIGTSVSNCQTDPVTDFVTYTAIVDGTTYPAGNIVTLLFSEASVVYGSASFPGLIMTNLQLGEVITLVTKGVWSTH
jgi:hypothetical protein